MKRPLKIVHFTQFLAIGGLEKIILELALEQKVQGHDVTVVVYDYLRDWVEYFKSNGIKVITSITKDEGIDGNLFFSLEKLIQSENPDIIHGHDINPMFYLGLLKLKSKVFVRPFPSLILTTHTLDHIEKSKKILFYETFLTRQCDKVVPVSKKIFDFYQNKLKLKNQRLALIENGIKIDESIRDTPFEIKKSLCHQYKLDPDRPLGLCLSRVTPLKNQEFLIKALSESDFQLLIVGPPSDESYYKFLERLIRDKPTIVMTGARTDVSFLNKGCDLFLSASTHEGLPVAVLEAMAQGTPCLISDIIGHQNIKDNSNGIILFREENTEDFNLKLNSILKTYSNGNSGKSEKLKEIVKSEYSIQKMEQNYFQLYLDALEVN